MSIYGGCRCGAIRYTIAINELPLTYACHCRDCQTWSGSAFILHALLPEGLLQIAGDVRAFQIGANEAMASIHLGCPTCMTRIANRNSMLPGMIVLRVGTLDRSEEVLPAAHIWTSRKQPWLDLGGSPVFLETPTATAFEEVLARRR